MLIVIGSFDAIYIYIDDIYIGHIGNEWWMIEEYVSSFSLPFWGQGVSFPSIILLSFIGLSGENVIVQFFFYLDVGASILMSNI